MTVGAAAPGVGQVPPAWLVYPDAERERETARPDEAGIDARAFDGWVRSKRFAAAGCGGERPGAYGSERS
jgi:hypothetical protein